MSRMTKMVAIAGLVLAAVVAYLVSVRATFMFAHKKEGGYVIALLADRDPDSMRSCLVEEKKDTVYFAGCGGFF